MQSILTSTHTVEKPAGTGGFFSPDIVVAEFGIEKGMRIADFGSGAGYFTISLAEKTGPEGKVYALDILENPLDSVRAKAQVYGLDNIEAIRTNLELLGGSSLPNESQDAVLMANILFQSNKRADIIKEGKRILKSGSQLIVIDWKKGSGGFGPPDNLRPDPEEVHQTVEKEGLVFERSFDAGRFHFGLVFRK